MLLKKRAVQFVPPFFCMSVKSCPQTIVNFLSGVLDEFRIETVQVCPIISVQLNCYTETNFKQIFPINKRKTIEIHQKFCYANFINQMSIGRNCDQSSIFSNSNKGTYIVQISHFNNCNSSGMPIHKLSDCIDWLINIGVFRQFILCRASILQK